MNRTSLSSSGEEKSLKENVLVTQGNQVEQRKTDGKNRWSRCCCISSTEVVVVPLDFDHTMSWNLYELVDLSAFPASLS